MKGPKLLRPIHPNAGLEAAYRRRLVQMTEEMHRDVKRLLTTSLKANEPIIARDESPAEALRRTMAELADRWLGRFDEMAARLAACFATSIEERSTGTLKRILKDGGFAVDFHMTPAMRDILDATVNENVSLIKSIPQQYLRQVEGIVMRGVQTGTDLAQISGDLQKQLGVTKRRAAFIARDQSSKATASFARARQIELGITKAVWIHSAGGKEPRPSHVKAGKDHVEFDLKEGWIDPATGKRIWPGTEINCRCVSKPVLPWLN